MQLVGGSSKQIKSLTLRRCTFPFDSSVPYRIPNLILEEPANLVGTAVDSMAYAATAIILPEHIVSLDLAGPTILPQLLPQLISLEKDFSGLRSLRVVLPAERSETWRASWARFLERCPALLALDIVGPANHDDAGLSLLTPNAVQPLEAFSGSVAAAVALLPGRRIRNLVIRLESEDTSESVISSVLDELAQLDEPTRDRIREFRLETDRVRQLFPRIATFKSTILRTT